MRSKFNRHSSQKSNRTEQHGSYIQNYLNAEIDALLAPSANLITQADFDALYIEIPEAEGQLKKYAHHTYTNNTCIVEGLTGAGKTMLVRHVFGIHEWQARIDGHNLIIPFSFDSIQNDEQSGTVADRVQSFFARKVRETCDCMVDSIPGLKNIDAHADEFYDSIKSHRRDWLYFIDRYPSPTKQEQLEALRDKHPLAFYSSALKFYLSQDDASYVDNVIIVVDDIEGINRIVSGAEFHRNELLPVKMTLELIEFLQNKGKSTISWSLNTVICCRHYVARIMRTLPYSRSMVPMVHEAEGIVTYTQALQAYAPCDRIDLSNPPSIMKIIRKRYSALREKGKSGSIKWETAMNVVMELLEKVDYHITDFIINLTLQNNRQAMKLIKQVVLNRRWVQREFPLTVQDALGAFEIRDIEQFRVTPVALIRALGMNESDVYHSEESPIPNLLYNEENPGMELYPLLTLKYFVQFVQISGKKFMDWHSSVSVSDFMNFAESVFGSDYHEPFQKSIRFLIK